MALLRLLLLVVFAYALFAILRAVAKRAKGIASSRASGSATEDMVLDPQCQSYLSKSDAVTRSGRYFCSKECAQLYLSR
jgi:hypothetical protein